MWSEVTHGAETWRREDEKRLDALEMWIPRKMEKVNWADKVSNEKLRIVEEK